MELNTALSANRAPAPSMQDFRRGTYDELISISGTLTIAGILKMMEPCLPATFVAFDSKGRGDALNLDLYGWDPEEKVAVIQIRMAFRRYKKGFLSTHKDYVLCGFNENGSPFRHPISAHAIRGAINAGADPIDTVRAAQRWMWSCTAKQLEEGRRQGDVLIVPERGQPKGDVKELGTEAKIVDTHIVTSRRLVRVPGKRHLMAIRPVLSHTKGEHRIAHSPLVDNTWFSVRVAETAPAWDYSQRLGD